MGTSPAAQLARIKVAHPAWSIRRIDHGRDSAPTFIAERDGHPSIKVDSLGELENALQRSAASWSG